MLRNKIQKNASRDISSVIYDDLKDKILNLTLLPGTPLSESEICSTFNSSRTPFRTAMHRLADQNLVDIMKYQEIRVSLINLDSVKQFIYARTAIEERVIRDFMAKDEALLIEDVDHLIRKQSIVFEQEKFKPEKFYSLDTSMHEIWFRTTEKLALWTLINSSVDYTRVRMLDIKEKKDYKSIIDDHKELLEVIRKKDYNSVYPIIERHLTGGIIRLEDRMNNNLDKYFK